MSGLSLLAGGGEALRSDSDSDGAEGTIIEQKQTPLLPFSRPTAYFHLHLLI